MLLRCNCHQPLMIVLLSALESKRERTRSEWFFFFAWLERQTVQRPFPGLSVCLAGLPRRKGVASCCWSPTSDLRCSARLGLQTCWDCRREAPRPAYFIFLRRNFALVLKSKILGPSRKWFCSFVTQAKFVARPVVRFVAK